MLPRVYRTVNLAPLTAGREILHDMACVFAEEQFRLKGQAPHMWLIAVGPHVIWLETNYANDFEKSLATSVVRDFIQMTEAQAYSSLAEVWTAALTPDKMSKAEIDHWSEFSATHGVRNLPPHLRDDALMVLSFDRAGKASSSHYIVQLRHGKGPDYLGPRIDDADSEATKWTGRMGNMFAEEKA